MRKILVLLFGLLLSINMCFAAYQPIPKEKSKQYKVQIEQIINNNLPKAYKQTDENFIEIKETYNQILKDPYNKELREKLDPETVTAKFDSSLFIIFLEIIEATENYVNIKNEIPATSHSFDLEIFMYPYLEDNNIDYKELSKYSEYASDKENEAFKLINSLPYID